MYHQHSGKAVTHIAEKFAIVTHEVTVEKSHHSAVKASLSVIRYAGIGMGALQTWHGSPDLTVRGTELTSDCKVFVHSNDEER